VEEFWPVAGGVRGCGRILLPSAEPLGTNSCAKMLNPGLSLRVAGDDILDSGRDGFLGCSLDADPSREVDIF
jgi:hypothetical protein